MDIAKKVEYTKVYLDSITQHDDAPMSEVEAAVADLASYASSGLMAAGVRRAAAAEAAQAVQPE